ncbi:MAG: hypothetical protein AB1626_03000, partial [Candidatus Micrarchaeota archaeon]
MGEKTVPREKIRVDIGEALEAGLSHANAVLAKKEKTPHNKEGLEPHRITLLHDLLPYAYLHTAHLPLDKLRQITASPAALRKYVDEVYGRVEPFKPRIAIEALQLDLAIFE